MLRLGLDGQKMVETGSKGDLEVSELGDKAEDSGDAERRNEGGEAGSCRRTMSWLRWDGWKRLWDLEEETSGQALILAEPRQQQMFHKQTAPPCDAPFSTS